MCALSPLDTKLLSVDGLRRAFRHTGYAEHVACDASRPSCMRMVSTQIATDYAKSAPTTSSRQAAAPRSRGCGISAGMRKTHPWILPAVGQARLRVRFGAGHTSTMRYARAERVRARTDAWVCLVVFTHRPELCTELRVGALVERQSNPRVMVQDHVSRSVPPCC